MLEKHTHCKPGEAFLLKKKMDLLEITLIALMAVLIIFTGMAAGYDRKVFVFQLVITVAALAFGIWRLLLLCGLRCC